MADKQAHKKYNKILKKVEAALGTGSTYGNTLNDYLFNIIGSKFAGVYPSDKIPTLSKNKPYVIVNLDDSRGDGTHWVACCYDKKGVLLYDSFGRRSNKILPALKKNNKKIKNSDLDAEQLISEDNCGQRSISWVLLFDKYGREVAEKI